VNDAHKKTGELMPVMTHMGTAAPLQRRVVEIAEPFGVVRGGRCRRQTHLDGTL